MIAQVGLAPGAVRDLAEMMPERYAKLVHQALTGELEARGALLVANPQEMRDLAAAVKDLNAPGSRKRWVTTIEELMKAKRVRYIAPPNEFTLDSVKELSELKTGWAGSERAALAVLPSSQATRIGVDETGLLMDEEVRFEVASIAAAPECATWQKIRELGEDGFIPNGAHRESFWGDVLAPIARLSKRVSILDRYIFTGVCLHDANRPRSLKWDADVVCWLLRRLDEISSPGTEVCLMGEVGFRDQPATAQNAAETVRRCWDPPAVGRLRQVEVIAGPWGRGVKRLPHDRHIRFSAGPAIRLAAGFDRLARRTVMDVDGMGWQHLWKPRAIGSLRAAEDRVAYADDTCRAAVLERQ